MAHGHPDYGAGAPTTTIYTIQDMAELAARLGSIVTFDRRGNVILLDDFESGIEGWEVDSSPAGYAVSWSPERHRGGGFSLKLVTNDTEDAYAGVYKGYPYPKPSRLGFEVSFIYGEYIKYFEFKNDVRDSTDQYMAYVRFVPDTNRWQYWSLAEAWVNLSPAYDLMQLQRIFHTIKLVVDMTTGKYVHLIVDDHTFDMSGLSMWTASAPGNPVLYTTIHAYTRSNDAAYTYVDDFIATINEP